jgi:hypothetical protein
MPVSIVDNSLVIPVRSKLSGLMYGTEEGRFGMAVLRGEERVLEGQTAVISFDSKALKRMFTVNYVNQEIRIRRLSSPGQTSL